MHHAGLADGRWHTMSLVEQLANVGSEVERAVHAHERHRPEAGMLRYARVRRRRPTPHDDG
jgi:hypothetical protein